jgi:hypothetical protein
MTERSTSGRESADAQYVQNLGQTLRKRNVTELREFLVRSATERNDPGEVAELQGIPDEVLEARMCKMIMARCDLQDLHDESRKWLIEHGYKPLGE